ncbi:MAG: hypothetical protein JXA89_15405, partial [Anaerolineae bacterium]|nr:hypothetical protein [Anaerolineae bacterium]
MKNRHEHPFQAIAGDLVDSLSRRDRQAGIHLARLVLADESDEEGAYRALAHALAEQLRHWPGKIQTIREDDMVKLIKAAARELLDQSWEE